jgi:hypothetical protein
MSLSGQSQGIEVAAKGWRFYPWGWRITWGLFLVVGSAYTYELLGPPNSLATGVWIVLVPLVVAGPMWVIFELQSQRRITVVPTGVSLDYPGRRTFVPWSRIQFSSNQPPHWYGTVLFLETKRKSALRQLAHHVTRDQAKAILAHMPNAPTDPQAQLLLGAGPAGVKAAS